MRYVEEFGAVGDGITDDSSAIQNALYSGTAHLTKGKHYYLAKNITVPETCHLTSEDVVGGAKGYDYNQEWLDKHTQLILHPTVSVFLDTSSKVSNVLVVRKELVIPAPDTDDWEGTAFSVTNNYSAWDIQIHNVLVLGFKQALLARRCPRLNLYNFHFDCVNGVNIAGAEDCIHLDLVEGWPYCAGPNPLTRGTAFTFGINCDAGKIRHCFSYGYTVGYKLENVSDMSFVQCGFDGVASPDIVKDSMGMYIKGNCWHTQITDMHGFCHDSGIVLDLNSKDHNVFIHNGCIGYNGKFNINVIQGTAYTNNVEFQTAATCFEGRVKDYESYFHSSIKRVFSNFFRNIFKKYLTF